MQIDLNDPMFASSPRRTRPWFRRRRQHGMFGPMVGRIPVMDVTPVVEGGRYPAKAAVGEPFPVSATIFREGHDELNADVVLTGPDGARRPPVRMRQGRHGARPLARRRSRRTPSGAWTFEIESWSDPVATWRHNAEIKIPAGIDVELMFTEGALLLERLAAELPKRVRRAARPSPTRSRRSATRPAPSRSATPPRSPPQIDALLAEHPLRDLVTTEGPYPFFADRERALFSSWYEFFPRSEGAYVDEETGKVVSGTLHTAAKRLDAVAEMGFDIIYLPPIHPIGRLNRKGREQHPRPAAPTTPGSPWAIGSDEGGHDAIHPDLGTFEDLDAFVARAQRARPRGRPRPRAPGGARTTPGSRSTPSGSPPAPTARIAYAENPPKKYQDIYPVNFDNDPEGIYAEVLRIVRLWMSHGVRVFRVDNPHTKPVEFWEWLLGEVRRPTRTCCSWPRRSPSRR